jgi:hypothetical protein
MTAEELIVKKFLDMERNIGALEEQLESERKEAEENRISLLSELADLDNVIHTLSKYVKVDEFSVTFELKKYIEEDAADIEYIKKFFSIPDASGESHEGEGGK